MHSRLHGTQSNGTSYINVRISGELNAFELSASGASAMKHDVQQEIKLRRYLLGELPLEEQVLVEQQLFLDSEYAELQQAVKDDLIDEYLVDELRGSEREEFVNHFLLLPEHGADLRIAEALKKYLATANTP